MGNLATINQPKFSKSMELATAHIDSLCWYMNGSVNGQETVEEANANMKLWEASPEMLGVLQSLLEENESSPSGPFLSTAQRLRVSNAIQKAIEL